MTRNLRLGRGGVPAVLRRTTAAPAPVTADVDINFGDYASITAMKAAPWYMPTGYINTESASSGITLAAASGTPNGHAKVLSLNYAIGAQGNNCPGIGFRTPFGVTRRFAVEIFARIPEECDSNGSGTGTADKKWCFINAGRVENIDGDDVYISYGRDENKVGNFGNMQFLDLRYNGGPDTLRITTTRVLNNGEYARYRLLSVMGGGTGEGVFIGEHVDLGLPETQRLDQLGFTRPATSAVVGPPHFLFPNNRNRESLTAYSIHLERVRLFDLDNGVSSDPFGWRAELGF